MPEAPVPLVTVLVAAYNGAATLPGALESALAQDVAPRAHVLVVDDGSTDDTPRIARRYAGRVQLVTQPHQGLAAACNTGVAAVRSPYVARLDADDTVRPGWLRRTVACLEPHPEAWGAAPDYVEVWPDGRRTRRVVEPDNLYSWLACGTVIRTSALRAVGGVRPMYWEEYDLYLRLRDLGPLLRVPEALYEYRKHAAAMTADAEARRAGWRQLLDAWGAERLQAAGACPELADVLAQEAARS